MPRSPSWKQPYGKCREAISWSSCLNPNGPVNVDASQLDQVIVNLVSECLRCMHQGTSPSKPPTSAGMSRRRAGTQCACGWLCAVGGTRQEQDGCHCRDRLFEPSSAPSHAGQAGLGLSTVYGVVSQVAVISSWIAHPNEDGVQIYLPQVSARRHRSPAPQLQRCTRVRNRADR
jgi:nitrogen-specific signal transduction histidine kinase